MVHGYHTIFGAYGFWLPNDPRGSWSDFIGSWEIAKFGRSTTSMDRQQLTDDEQRQRQAAKLVLKYPPVQFTGTQARTIGRGFATCVQASNLSIWACSILPEHVHLVVARHTYAAELIANQLKGQATKQLRKEQIDPLQSYAKPGHRPPAPWATGQWIVYLDTEEAIDGAIHYVEQNPIKEGKPLQSWPCVTPFSGLDPGWVTYR